LVAPASGRPAGGEPAPLQYLLQEPRRRLQPFLVDAVAEAGPRQRLDRHAVRRERRFAVRQRLEGHHRVGIAMDEQHGRLAAYFRRQRVGADQPAGKADDAGDRMEAAQPDIERHHRALREADEGEVLLGEAARAQRVVDEGVEHGRRRAHAGEHRLGAAVLHAEPLVAVRRHVAGKGRVGRDELGIGQEGRPDRRQADEVVAVGAEPVQQDDEPARRAARRRLVDGAAEFRQHGSGRPCVREVGGSGEGYNHQDTKAPRRSRRALPMSRLGVLVSWW
jgi:hypothetical protein